MRNDFSSFWMPFTDNRGFSRQPMLLASAKDMHYFTEDGRPVLDATSGLWCVNAGHGRAKIVEAIQRQAAKLDFSPNFQIGHPIAFEFADRLVEILPRSFNRVFFTNSGSEAVDTSLKIALAYQRAIGQGSRTRLIGRERGYHGVGFGGISVGGIVSNRRMFGPLLPGSDHLRHTHDPSRGICRGQPANGAELADDLERLVMLHGAETIAAVIVEPVAASTGVLVPPQGYLERVREIATRHGILLIFDEVVTAFGRLGAATASEYFGVCPDLITLAKGLTNASVPMGAVAVSDQIQDAILESASRGIEFFHGYTYSGHPLAAAGGRGSRAGPGQPRSVSRRKALQPSSRFGCQVGSSRS
jgi:beta-alanine--pyruvate transaminase